MRIRTLYSGSEGLNAEATHDVLQLENFGFIGLTRPLLLFLTLQVLTVTKV